MVSQHDIDKDLNGSINNSADIIAFQLQERMNHAKGNVTAKDRLWLRAEMEMGVIGSVTLLYSEKIITFGKSKDSWVKLFRNIKLNNTQNPVKVVLKHPPLEKLIAANRRALIIKIGGPFVIFAFVLIWFTKYTLASPISDLVSATRSVTEGDLNKRIVVMRHDEFGQLGNFFNEMLDKLQDQQEKLEAAVKAAESASLAKSHFLANMSHEIRTPLTAIIGFSELLRDGNLTKSQASKELESIIRNGIHLQQIINDVLDLSKIEAGQLDIESIMVSPFSILNDVESLFSSRAKEKGLNLNVHYEYPLPVEITTDPIRFKQILVNLCSNAIKFTSTGSINLLMRYLEESQRLLVVVTDTGVGMDENEQQTIFQPFTQADVSTTRKFGGTGLGLCISSQLAEKLGGKVYCQSKKGIGSQFMVEVDAGIQSRECLINSRNIVEIKASYVHKSIDKRAFSGRVLLAEDNEENRRLLGFYLKRVGLDFVVVENGARAVQYGLSESVDLVLMDMQMPVMDGLSAIRLLRQQGFEKPIVVLTANVLAEDREACIKAGANEFLTKPVDVERFYAVLDQYLERQTSS
ncbi:MAG: response regulator [Ectothiorhodospiraceae bacterium]|nr:response regulator [Ectothiorhodospiraceae bacterium]